MSDYSNYVRSLSDEEMAALQQKLNAEQVGIRNALDQILEPVESDPDAVDLSDPKEAIAFAKSGAVDQESAGRLRALLQDKSVKLRIVGQELRDRQQRKAILDAARDVVNRERNLLQLASEIEGHIEAVNGTPAKAYFTGNDAHKIRQALQNAKKMLGESKS